MGVKGLPYDGTSTIRDPSAVGPGRMKIDWARAQMPVLAEVARLGAGKLAGRRVAACLHLEAKTACLLTTIRDLGAEVVVCGSNPLSTQDDVVAALAAEEGIFVHAWRGATAEEYRNFLRRAAASGPDIVVDDGADLIATMHTEFQDEAGRVLGGAEETTTGIIRLKAMAADGVLRFPVLAVNDTPMKRIFDNKYGTGQSVWDGIMRTTNLTVAGKTVVVVGYGFCGKGVAMRGSGLGARVVVVEVNPVAACEALMDGHQVMPMGDAAAVGDVFVTTTGCRDAIRGEHLALMKDGVLLANAGHFNVEINLDDLQAACDGSPRRIRPGIDEYRTRDGRRLFLLGEGRLVNLAAGDGHPVEVMDLSFALQALGALFIAAGGLDGLGGRVAGYPPELDRQVAGLRLRASGVKIEGLTPGQAEYLRSWRA